MKRLANFFIALVILAVAGRSDDSPAQKLPVINFHPGAAYGPNQRKYQGIPTIERAPNGRLWAAWYAGPVQEDRYNYVVVVTSGDDGWTWSDLQMVIDPDGFGLIRASDPCLWLDPRGRLWLFWFQNLDKEVTSPKLFAITTENSGDEKPRWSTPRFIGEGIMINKPTVLANGNWLLPAAIWRRDQSCLVLASSDEGKSWQLRGSAGIPRPEDRQCDEPMIVERRDRSLWMLVRTNYGIGETTSTDGGRTWTPILPANLPHTPTRFFLRRLVSGRLLLVKHGPLAGKPVGRKQLQAYLSDDEGRSWRGGLMLDERSSSYPDATQSPDGTIRLIYDHDRMDAKHILLAAFSETDVLRAESTRANADAEHQGIQNFAAPVTAPSSARFRVLINAATGINTRPWLKDGRFLRPRANDDGARLLEGPAAELEVVAGAGEIHQIAAAEKFFSPPLNTPSGLCVATPGQRVYLDQPEEINVVPEALAGKRYILAYSGHAVARCRTGGIVYVVTPSRERIPTGAGEALRANGFAKAAVPEFVLFLTKDNRALPDNLCSVFQKTVRSGDRIEISRPGMIVY